MEYADGLAAGVALAGLVYAVASYARKKERDSLMMAIFCGVLLVVASVSAFAPNAAGLLSPLIWAAIVAAVVVIRRERRRQRRAD